MKKLLFFLSILYSLNGMSQTVQGLYAGTLRNDTTGLTQQYELFLEQKAGKVTGYAHTTFVLNDRFHFGFRKVKGKIENGKLYVEEDEMLENNFPVPPPKGIKRLSVFMVDGDGTVELLEGNWATNRTRQWAPATGTVRLQRKRDSTSSPLITRLNERNPARQVIPEKKVLGFTDRKTNTLQTISFHSDSVRISLYDNGLVDGDSVAVYLNGKPILEHIRLSETAVRHTIYFKSAGSYELALMAENLGTLPPNTGLLIVQDGEQRYFVYYSADLGTNARIILKKE
jgi:hypothetical protein